MTGAEARAVLAAFDGVGGLERWITEQRPWQAAPGGWAVSGELHGLRFRVALVTGGMRLTASKGMGWPAVWTVPRRGADLRVPAPGQAAKVVGSVSA